MSGRHRQGGPGITRRALAGTVPVLGAAGAATGLVLSSGAAAAPDSTDTIDAGATTDEAVTPTAAETTAPPPTVRTHVPGRADQAVSAVAAATDAARDRNALDQSQDQRSVTAAVEQVRADARSRDAAAQQQGRTELEQFQDQQAREQRQARAQEQERGDSPSEPLSPSELAGAADPSSDPGECDLSGLPRLSPSADSDEIVNRDCGMTDDRGRERSQDPWIDGQMLSEDEEFFSTY